LKTIIQESCEEDSIGACFLACSLLLGAKLTVDGVFAAIVVLTAVVVPTVEVSAVTTTELSRYSKEAGSFHQSKKHVKPNKSESVV
jgi:hypothetical protein